MPTYDPDLTGALRSLQRQIDQINTSRPGPMSWGPDDGHIRFYAADGKVLFQANSGGASVVSRGSLTSMTGLFDGIRDKNDAQDGVLSDHRTWLVGHGERLDGHDADVKRIDGVNDAQNGRLNDHHGWIGSLGTRMTSVEGVNDAQNGRLNTHQGWIGSLGDRMGSVEGVNNAQNGRLNDHADWIAGARSAAQAAQSRADNAHADAATAQARANSAYSRAGTGISDAAAAASAASSARSRADAAYSLAATRAAASTVSDLDAYMRAQVARLDARINNLPGS